MGNASFTNGIGTTSKIECGLYFILFYFLEDHQNKSMLMGGMHEVYLAILLCLNTPCYGYSVGQLRLCDIALALSAECRLQILQ